MVDRNLKRSRATWIFSQKLVELGWLYKQVRFEKFCMCSFVAACERLLLSPVEKYLVFSSQEQCNTFCMKKTTTHLI